jgi:hypothetical protein
MATRYGNINFIWSHSGGSLLGFVGRFLGNPTNPLNLDTPAKPNSGLYHLRRFYYDTASSANPVQMHAMKEFVGASQIVFGTDFPYCFFADRRRPIVSSYRALHRNEPVRRRDLSVWRREYAAQGQIRLAESARSFSTSIDSPLC